MPIAKYALLFTVIILFYSCGNPEVKQKTDSLKNVVSPVKSIDPKDEDYSDLQFLKKIIERDSVKVIMLGEASHGDGSTFLAKTRLIKFLHKEAGFDVLAWESGLFDCTWGWERVQESGKYYEEIRRAVFGLWVGTKECEDLLDYLQSTLNTPRPLEMSGFDSQITGYNYNNCQVFIEEMKKLGLDLLTQGEENLFVKLACLREDIKRGENKTYNISVIDKVIGKFDSLAAADKKYEYWRNIVYGVRATYKSVISRTEDMKVISTDFNERDIQMGNNLVWLLNNKYKNRKVIVWAASFHNSRNLGELTAYDDSLSYINKMYKKTTTMGDVVHKAFGNKMYSVFFTSYSGNARGMKMGDEENIDEPAEGSIENIFRGLGYDYAFLDMRDPQNPEWVKQAFTSRPLGHKEMTGNWSNVTDGIFYIKKMQPSNYH